MNWAYTGDDPAVFPTLRNPDGTTVFVRPGEVVDLGEQEPGHRWLQPTDKAVTVRDDGAPNDVDDAPNDDDAAAATPPDASTENAPQA